MMYSINKAFFGFALFTLPCLVCSCTDVGQTTQVSAATGGVIGAGLGAIVGNQTGSTAGGLTVGAIAGAGTGAMVGNMLENQEHAIRTQDEAIERQQRLIAAQKSEIEELRKMDSSSNAQYSAARTNALRESMRLSERSHANTKNYEARGALKYPSKPATPSSAAKSLNSHSSTKPSGNIKEATLIAPSTKYTRSPPKPVMPEALPAAPQEPDHSSHFKSEHDNINNTVTSAVNAPSAELGTDCKQAQAEIESAHVTRELADKLFHYRRALRLCPNEPSYHNGLGEIYRALDRQTDAEFEFKEALNLDPNFQAAKDNINTLKR